LSWDLGKKEQFLCTSCLVCDMEPGALLSEEQLLRMSGPVSGPEPGEMLAEGPQSVLGLKGKTILAQVRPGLGAGTRSTACRGLNGPSP
jgi:hypothetical protein